MDLKTFSFSISSRAALQGFNFCFVLGGGKGGGVVRGQVSKDQLDKQLDDYMSKGSA